MSDQENQRLMEQISQLAGKYPWSCKQAVKHCFLLANTSTLDILSSHASGKHET